MFQLLLDAGFTSEAVEELLVARSVALGQQMAENGGDPRVKSAQRSLLRRAYPEIVEYPKLEEGTDG